MMANLNAPSTITSPSQEGEEPSSSSSSSSQQQIPSYTNDMWPSPLVLAPTPQELGPMVNCPICLNMMVSPTKIFSCLNGHNVCSDCYPQLRSCPVCRQQYDVKVRNLFAEHLIGKCQFHCEFLINGCTQVEIGERIGQHQTNCEYNPSNCIQCKRSTLLRKLASIRAAMNEETEGDIAFRTSYHVCQLDHNSGLIAAKVGRVYLGHNHLIFHMTKNAYSHSAFWISSKDNLVYADDTNYFSQIMIWNERVGSEFTYSHVGPITITTNAPTPGQLINGNMGLVLPNSWAPKFACHLHGKINVLFRISENIGTLQISNDFPNYWIKLRRNAIASRVMIATEDELEIGLTIIQMMPDSLPLPNMDSAASSASSASNSQGIPGEEQGDDGSVAGTSAPSDVQAFRRARKRTRDEIDLTTPVLESIQEENGEVMLEQSID